MNMETHSFISDLAMVFDVVVESKDTGFNGVRSSTCDEARAANLRTLPSRSTTSW